MLARSRTSASSKRRRTSRLTAQQAHVEVLESRELLSGSPLVVDTLEDDATPDNGKFSLREAIEAANAAAGPDTVRFEQDLTGTIALTLGELLITDDVTIRGPGWSELEVSGEGVSRVFNVQPETSVSIAHLTISDGLADGTAPDFPSTGGAILNQGDLSLSHVIVQDSRAEGADVDVLVTPVFFVAGGAGGGGLANFGQVSISHSQFLRNEAVGADGIVRPFNSFPVAPNFIGFGFGGGIANLGDATISHSRFRDNLAQAGSEGEGDFAGISSGGAILNDRNLSIAHSSFHGNRSLAGDETVGASPLFHNGHALGGAITSGSLLPAIDPTAIGGVLDIRHSSFSHNQGVGGDDNQLVAFDADGNPIPVDPGAIVRSDGPNNAFGGALLVYQGSASLRHINFTNNAAIGGAGGGDLNGSLGVGGGIFFFDFLGGVTADAEFLRLRGNKAIGGAGTNGSRGGDGIGGGIAIGSLDSLFAGPGNVSITKSYVAGNYAVGGAGDQTGAGGFGLGGGVALVSSANASISWTMVRANKAAGGDGGTGGNGLGGGIYNEEGGSLTLARSLIFRNRAIGGSGTDGGTDGQGIGGGIFNEGDLTIDLVTEFFTRFNEADLFDDIFGI